MKGSSITSAAQPLDPAERQHLYVLGHPVAHSLSPLLHGRAYDALHLNWEYGRADCPAEAEARAFIEQRAFLAINITMPYKPLALATATWKSAAAVLAQGANMLAVRGDEMLADNTDGKGCVMALKREGVVFEGARIIVCGTGPTSLSIAHAVACAGAVRIDLLGRDEAKAQRILDGYRARARGVGVSETAEFVAGDYASACDAAIKEVETRLRELFKEAKPGAPVPKEPEQLIGALLSDNCPYVFCDTSEVSGKNFRKGTKAIFDGVFTAYRNPSMHANIPNTQKEALEQIVQASQMMTILTQGEIVK